MDRKIYHTYNEIKSQPQAWAGTLDMLARRRDEWLEFFGAGNFDSVVLTGCGSMYYMPLAASVGWQGWRGFGCRHWRVECASARD